MGRPTKYHCGKRVHHLNHYWVDENGWGSVCPGGWTVAYTPVYINQYSFFTMAECPDCGAVVKDTAVHDSWHDSLLDMLK